MLSGQVICWRLKHLINMPVSNISTSSSAVVNPAPPSSGCWDFISRIWEAVSKCLQSLFSCCFGNKPETRIDPSRVIIQPPRTFLEALCQGNDALATQFLEDEIEKIKDSITCEMTFNRICALGLVQTAQRFYEHVNFRFERLQEALSCTIQGDGPLPMRLKVAEFLLSKEPSLATSPIRNFSCSLHHYAILKGEIPFIELLERSGTDYAKPDSQGHTALHYAVMAKKKEMVTYFLKRGLDPHAQNKRGETPLQRAQRENLWEIAKLLQK